MRRSISHLAMLMAVLWITGAAFAQDTSSITGTVRDSSGAIAPGALVEVSNPAQGLTRTTQTNNEGAFLLAGLPAGNYNLNISCPGFKVYRVENVVLRAAEKARADASLELGAISTQITVQGETVAQVDTQTAQLGGTVTGQQTSQLELNGRNFTQLISLVPGVNNQTGQDEGTVGVYGSVAYSVNGGRTEYNNWELDSVGIVDSGSASTLNVYPSIDAIAETAVLTSNYGAQYGENASGTILAITKSGTSQLHGAVYEFNRNDVFNARSFFDVDRPPYKKNDFGYTLSGPFSLPGIYNPGKDKTFFFWSEEWRKEENPDTFNVQVPSLQERQGNFSDLCPGPDCPVNPVTGSPFNGNQVPVDPNAEILLGRIPAPNYGTGANSFYRASPSFPTDWREELARVDQNVTPTLRLMARYIHDSWQTVTPTPLWSTSSFPTASTNFRGPGASMVAHLTAVTSPTLLNEFIFGYSEDYIVVQNKGYWQRPSGMTMTGLFNNGFGGTLPGISLCCNEEDMGGNGMVEDSGFVNPANPNFNSNPVYTFRHNLSKIMGTHNLTLGADFIAFQKNEQNGATPAYEQGFLTFSTSSAVTTGNALADMFTGSIARFKQLNQELKYYNRYKILSPYLQDDWHATRRLTLNLGLRVELFGTFRTKYANEYNFDLAAYNPANAPEIDVDGSLTGQAGALIPGVGNPYDGMVQCGASGVPAGCMKGHLFNPAPRLGFAWDPTGKGTTALRGGYGIFYEHTNGDEANAESLEGTPPLAQTPSAYDVVGYTNIGGGAGVLFPLGVTSIENQIRWPYAQQWNVAVEHHLGAGFVLSAAYVGSKGTHLTGQRDLNQLPPVPASQNPFKAGQPITSDICGAGPPFVVNQQTVSGQAATNLGVACGADPDPYRPVSGYGDITSLATQANSTYNALQISLRRTVGRLNLSAAYTYSHSLDDSSDRYDASFVNSYDLRQTYANSNFDQRHVLNVSYVYNLPSAGKSGLLHSTAGGWQVSGITSLQTGTPFSVMNGVIGDNAGVGNGITLGSSGAASFPDIIGNVHAPPVQKNVPGVWGPLLYNPAAFGAPQGLTFGDAGRNILTNPGRFNWDMGLFKQIPLPMEKVHLQFRAEGFNLLNHPQLYVTSPTATGNVVTTGCYGGPNNSAGDPGCLAGSTFLRATGAHLGRIYQLGLKLMF
jgi:hypothetical protein